MIAVFLVILVVFLATTEGGRPSATVDDWEQFKQQHGRNFTNNRTEENSRRANYNRNKAAVQEHNSNSSTTWKMDMNDFSDMSYQEIAATRLGARPPATVLTSQVSAGPQLISVTALPTSLDWRTNGAVTPVENQGNCGSCWTFSATGALEGRRFLKTGYLLSLSEQNLLDCSWSYGNSGCNGGWMTDAFRYVRAVGGLNSASSYPYTARSSGTCRFNSASTAKYAALNSTIYYSIKIGNETALMEALQSGPVSIAFNVVWSFQNYRSGVYQDSTCGTRSANHAMLLVGYGTDTSTGKPYWIVKNTWGTSWGEQGYIRVLRGVNMCAIATYASYPILA